MIYIILGTIPAVVVGLLFESVVENAFSDPRFASGMLLVTAAILFATLFVNRTDKPLTTQNTVAMGFAQALAILPGISRSGSTISFGLFLRVSGDQAARFSFLLSIPAILGATILKSAEIAVAGISSTQLGLLALGTLVAFISGTVAIKTLLHIVRKGKLYWFAPYCLIIGLLGLFVL
jgi:undecaprenyl-diphosphatase